MEEQFNKEANQGWRFAADAARVIDDSAGGVDRKHTSGSLSSNRQHSGRMKEGSPRHGCMSKDVCRFLQSISGIRKDGRPGMKHDGRSGEAGENFQAFLVGRL